ncbi:hypothetical protein BN1002_00181 [Bacillus sp. B-jedd]|nr:hypothetical protein BN1002_00181 [Bacillus sp. B-jedd]
MIEEDICLLGGLLLSKTNVNVQQNGGQFVFSCVFYYRDGKYAGGTPKLHRVRPMDFHLQVH